jgi:GH25 family lysozyme M1 (1,4-beta-N-acetylmuramidase)
MAQIEGADWSHWQGVVDCAKAKSAGLRFAGIKVSQGIGYKDDRAEVNNANARANGLLTFPYHFLTDDDATAQYNWFMSCIGTQKFDLPAALDYEYYNPVTMNQYSPLNDDKYSCNLSLEDLRFFTEKYKLIIPTSNILLAMANKLKGWNGFSHPVIYTNPSTANSKLLGTSWSQFLLWIAHWNVATPTIPTAWKGKKVYIWQDKVIHGAQSYGVDGDMDHDVWGDAIPFPGTPTNEITGTIYIKELDKTLTLREA